MNNEFLANSTPEQRNLWHYVRTLIAFNTITPLYYQGVIAGSEFLTYAVGKLYVSLEFLASYSVVNSSGYGAVEFYNQNNIVSFYLTKSSAAYDSTAATMFQQKSTALLKNSYFSRITTLAYNYMIFNGYRLDV